MADRPAGRHGPGDLHGRSRDPPHAQVDGRAIATATRPTSRSSPTPGSSPPAISPPPTPATARPASACSPAKNPACEVLGDSAYGSGPVRADLAAAEHTAVIKPWPLGRNPKLGDDQFARDDFTIDYQNRHRDLPRRPAPCTITASGARHLRDPMPGCPVRHRCTSASRRQDLQGQRTRPAPRRTPEPTGATGPASTTTANTGPWSNAPSPGSSPTTTAASATAASNATGIGLSTRAAAINLRRLLNLGLHHGPTGWTIT